MLHFLVFTICVTLLVSGAPYYGGSGRITGGTRVNHTEQFPYVVSISRLDQHICNGVIYNDRWIITAANCVHGKNQSEFKVIIGALSLIIPDPAEQKITVSDFVVFNQFDPVSLKHDIALVRLSRLILFGATAQPMRYGEIDELATPWDAYIVGWGATFEGGIPTTKLLWGPIDELAADCGVYVDEFQQDSMICAGSTEGTISPCQYDEGGPLTQRTNSSGTPEEIVVGIMSRNNGCGDPSIDYEVKTAIGSISPRGIVRSDASACR